MYNIDEYELYDAIKDYIPEDVVPLPDDIDVEALEDYLRERFTPLELLSLVLSRVIIGQVSLTKELVVGLPEYGEPHVFAWRGRHIGGE